MIVVGIASFVGALISAYWGDRCYVGSVQRQCCAWLTVVFLFVGTVATVIGWPHAW